MVEFLLRGTGNSNGRIEASFSGSHYRISEKELSKGLGIFVVIETLRDKDRRCIKSVEASTRFENSDGESE